VEGVGDKEHFCFDLAVAALDGQPPRGCRVTQQLAVNRDLVMRHDRRNFRHVEVLFTFLARVRLILWLGLRGGRLLLGRLGGGTGRRWRRFWLLLLAATRRLGGLGTLGFLGKNGGGQG